MIVLPPFAQGKKKDEWGILTVVGRGIIPIATQMTKGVDKKNRVPHVYRPHTSSPKHKRSSEIQAPHAVTEEKKGQKAQHAHTVLVSI